MIEIGEYVRTKEKGYIGRILSIDEDNEWIETTLEKEYTHHIDEFKIKPKIIDLIEVGDYVNGCEVLDIHIPRDIWDPVEIRINSRYANFLLADEIKTIVTKEQMASIEYRVEEE